MCFYTAEFKVLHKIVEGMSKVFHCVIYYHNITEWSQFTRHNIFGDRKQTQENNIKITFKATFKTAKITLELLLKEVQKVTIQVACIEYHLKD
jgi:hypothetical protein